MRWELIDQFEVLKKGFYARAVKAYEGSEDFFAGHDPGRPRVPEPLFLEMIAQTGGVLLGLGMNFQKEVILAKIEDAGFPRSSKPPCRYTIEAKIEEQREEGAWISGTVREGKGTVAHAKILLVAIDALKTDSGDRVVFNQRFLSHYDIENVAKKSERMPI